MKTDGYHPFKLDTDTKDMTPRSGSKLSNAIKIEAIKKGDFKIPETWKDEEVSSLVLSLLELDPEKRLGSNGVEEIKSHKYFEGIDWEKLAKKEITPPFVP
jgi:serine/threonine protein kinase